MTNGQNMGPAKARFLVTVALASSVVLAASLGLSACGKMGSLETAPPMFGKKARADWSASHSSSDSSSSAAKSPMAAGSTTMTVAMADTSNASASAASEGFSISSASLSGGGSTATLAPTDKTKKETERALPDANGKNNSPDPYRGNKKISDAPLEGFSNGEGH